jgi:hypothetical protein
MLQREIAFELDPQVARRASCNLFGFFPLAGADLVISKDRPEFTEGLIRICV